MELDTTGEGVFVPRLILSFSANNYVCGEGNRKGEGGGVAVSPPDCTILDVKTTIHVIQSSPSFHR